MNSYFAPTRTFVPSPEAEREQASDAFVEALERAMTAARNAFLADAITADDLVVLGDAMSDWIEPGLPQSALTSASRSVLEAVREWR